jgi:hypothetical protein
MFYKLCLIIVFLLALNLPAGLLYRVNFESGNTDASPGTSNKEEWYGGVISAVNNPQKDSRNGSDMAGQCRVPHDYTRAELSSQRLTTENKTYVYKWSYYLPDDFFTNADLSWSLLCQWKTWPCGDHDGYDAEICHRCGIFNDLSAGTETDPHFEFRWRAEPDCREQTEDMILGQWVDFMMEIRWTNANDGYAKLWINDSLIKDLGNIKTLMDNFDASRCNMYWAVGIYTSWTGSKEFLDVYIDNVEIWDTSGVSPASEGSFDFPGPEMNRVAVCSRNPFQSTVIMQYTLAKPQFITIRIFDSTGREVSVLAVGQHNPGAYLARWDARDLSGNLLPNGVYYCSMQTKDRLITDKIILLK